MNLTLPDIAQQASQKVKRKKNQLDENSDMHRSLAPIVNDFTAPKIQDLTMSLNRGYQKDIVRYVDNILERSKAAFAQEGIGQRLQAIPRFQSIQQPYLLTTLNANQYKYRKTSEANSPEIKQFNSKQNRSQTLERYLPLKSTQSTQQSNKIKIMSPFKLETPRNVKSEERFKNFIVHSFLGKGKFSEVFLAREKRTNLFVALKVIKKDIIKQYRMDNQFTWEIKIQYLMRHPSIVRLYSFFHTGMCLIIFEVDEIVLVQEYCPEGPLIQKLKQSLNGRLEEPEAVMYVRQVAQAISFLHANEIIHRDIKPENILLTYVVNYLYNQNQAKLADFSFCIYTPDEYRQTQCGTFEYSSPEITTGDLYDKKSDMWALGVLAFELCAGYTPWDDLPKNQVLDAIKNADIKYPPWFSNDLKNFIESLTKRISRDRLNARQALSHPWLNKVQDNSNLNDFKDLNKLF